MPACTLHLVALTPSTSLQKFLQTLSYADIQPLTISRVIRWIILPQKLSTSTLLAQNIHWDLLLILPSTSPLPRSLQSLIKHQWSVQAGVPGKIVNGFNDRNKRLLKPHKGDVPELTGALNKPRIAESTQALELSPELRTWIEEFNKGEGSGAVSMLNLLAFKPNMKSEYLKYGAEFARSIGSSRGGNAKIVGSVIHGDEGGKDGEGWDEVALAHYPSILHFGDMLASEDYQVVNHKHRVPSLEDTFILCTSELGMEEMLKRDGPKL